MVIKSSAPVAQEDAAKKVFEDADVQLLWSHLTSSQEEVVTNELLRRLIQQWLTLRGFSQAASFMED